MKFGKIYISKKISSIIILMKTIIIESIIIGIVTMILGKIISNILLGMNKIDKKNKLPIWKEPRVIEISLFVTGVFLHLVCEYIGLNKWYCDKETKTCVRRIALLN